LGLRAKLEYQGRVKKYVAAVGALEMGRIMEEMGTVEAQVLLVGPAVKVKGEWNKIKMMQVLEELEQCEVTPDYILVNEPGHAWKGGCL
jgi:hypothetical protein